MDYNQIDETVPFKLPPNNTIDPIWINKQKFNNLNTSKKINSFYSSDRFIPDINQIDFDLSYYNIIHNKNKNSDIKSFGKEEYEKQLADCFFDEKKSSKILNFKAKKCNRKDKYENSFKNLYSEYKLNKLKKIRRKIPTKPEKILEAPGVIDDYYLNLLDWSSGNIIAICLGQEIYLWEEKNSNIYNLCEIGGQNYFTSVSWGSDNNVLGIGNSLGETQIWDITKMKKIRTMRGHSQRVSSLSWNKYIISSGSKDGTILNHDVRIKNDITHNWDNHRLEVCGLKWNTNGIQLASGGNDDILNIWDLSNPNVNTPKFIIDEHSASVKALDWSPWQQNLLASGGGSSDKTIKIWNTSNGSLLNSTNTRSQVTSLLWSKNQNEIVTSHGFQNNGLNIWDCKSMQKIAELKENESRVLNMAMSPNGETIASLSSDESLKFWKIFEKEKKKKNKQKKIVKENSFQLMKNIR